MTVLGLALLGLPIGLAVYTYAGYPLLLKLWGLRRGKEYPRTDPESWPLVSVSLPVHNEEAVIGGTIESFLALDYPKNRLQILVISDASTDGTDEIVRGYEAAGVGLLRLEGRGGKTAAENAALRSLSGTIVLNTDATTRLLPDALRRLVTALQDPEIGVASGRDLSVGNAEAANRGESRYVGYEMWVRSLETRAGSIVGASGCCYAIRRELHARPVSANLSRDFLSALRAHEAGLRAVSVNEAVCVVPRTGSIGAEYRRKIRTMARGLETLWYKRHLLNPFRHGRFAVVLFSHKLCRWLVPLGLPTAVAGMAILGLEVRPVRWLLVAGLLGTAAGAYGILRGDGSSGASSRTRGSLDLLGYALASNVAAFAGWMRFLRQERDPTWEPTRRPPVP